MLVVAPTALPPGAAARIRKLPGVIAAQSIDAANIKVNGKYVSMLGVDPSAFRGFAARPTASVRQTLAQRGRAAGSPSPTPWAAWTSCRWAAR